MLHPANATRCSLVFALLMLVYSVENSAAFAGSAGLPAHNQPRTVNPGHTTTVSVSWEVSEQTSNACPSVASNHPQSDLQATNRRSNETRSPNSRLRGIRPAVESRTELTGRLGITPNQTFGLNSELVEFECLQAPIHETRGKPEGQVISARIEDSMKSLPDETRGADQWSLDRPGKSFT